MKAWSHQVLVVGVGVDAPKEVVIAQSAGEITKIVVEMVHLTLDQYTCLLQLFFSHSQTVYFIFNKISKCQKILHDEFLNNLFFFLAIVIMFS